MNTQIELVLRNPLQSKDCVELFFDVFDLPLAARWVEELRQSLHRPHLLEKNSSFLGFIHGPRSRELLCTQMNEAAEVIRQYRGAPPWHVPYSIPEFCDPKNLSFDLLNSFHHHFELLMGGTFAVSDFYRTAPVQIRKAIRLINYSVHELEAIERSWMNFTKIGKIYPYSVVEILEKSPIRKDLADEDYSVFSLENVFGDLQVAYCQTGKTPYEAWRDNDSEIFHENINGMQFYSPSFNIRWGHTSDPANQKKNRIDPFYRWLEEKGADLGPKTYYVDKKGKRHGLGFLTVGRLSSQGISGLSVEEIQNLVSRHCDIYKIRLHQANQLTEKTYEYFLNDETFSQQIINILEGYGPMASNKPGEVKSPSAEVHVATGPA